MAEWQSGREQITDGQMEDRQSESRESKKQKKGSRKICGERIGKGQVADGQIETTIEDVIPAIFSARRIRFAEGGNPWFFNMRFSCFLRRGTGKAAIMAQLESSME